MYTTVSLKVELDATSTLEEIEQRIQEAGRVAMQEAFKEAIKQREDEQPQCPDCGSEQSRSQGSKQRVLLTQFGRVELLLRRKQCQACQKRFRPAEALLQSVKGQCITKPLRELAALVGSSWPYATAAQVLHRLSGTQISAERLRQLTNEQGSVLVNEQEEQAQHILQEAVSMQQIRAQRVDRDSRARGLQPEWLQVGLDGGWIPSREQKGGMEGKVGVIASQLVPVGKRGRHRLICRKYVATFAPAEQMGRLTYAAACDLQATEAKRQVVLADGADWIKQQADEHFPEAVKILDWPHLYRKIRDAVRSLQPGKRADRRAWRKKQYDRLFPLLWEGKREEALTHLQSLRPAHGEALPAFESAVQYLSTQRDWIGNYQRWKQQGYPVGSGLVERAVTVVINARMKKRGMRWNRANASAVVALRVERINADWQAAA